MRLFAAIGTDKEGKEVLWTEATPDGRAHAEQEIGKYKRVGGETYVMRVAEFVELAHAPTDRPPAPEGS